MSNDEGMIKFLKRAQQRYSSFKASTLFRHSDFVI